MDTQMILGKQPKQHRTLWISDVHLGTRNCQARALLDFLAYNEAQTIYLVGDIIDGWKMLKVPVLNALETQALLFHYKNYCQKKNCLNCGIGFQLLKKIE